MIKQHPAYIYASSVVNHKVYAPNYVIKQCKLFKDICEGKDKTCFVDEKMLKKISMILKVIRMPKGLK